MDNPFEKIRSVAVYCGSSVPADPVYNAAARELAAFLAAHNMTLVYGGSNVGTMKVLADSMLEFGGKVVGVTIPKFEKHIAHRGLTELIVAPSLAARKAKMLELADAVVALPGSFGTWDELCDALAQRKITRTHKFPVGVLNVNGFYDPLLELFRRSVGAGYTKQRYLKLLKSGNTPEELFQHFTNETMNSSSAKK